MTVLSTLLYAAETWTTYARHLRQLESFHMRCLRHILNIKWFQRLTNAQVRHKAHINFTISGLVRQRRLRWLGHVERRKDDRLPKQILHGWVDGTRPFHRPKRRWTDCIVEDLESVHMYWRNKWREECKNRVNWRQIVNTQVIAAARTKWEKWEEKIRERRHEYQKRQQQNSHRTNHTFNTPSNSSSSSNVVDLTCGTNGCSFKAKNTSGLTRHRNCKHK